MREIFDSPKIRSRSESAAIFIICALFAALAGWVSLYFAGLFRINVLGVVPSGPGTVLSALLWMAVFTLMGASLFLAITSDTLTKTKYILRNCSLSLWLGVFAMLVTLPFFMYRLQIHATAFVWLSVMLAAAIGYAVISLKIRPLNALILLPVTAWLLFLTYAALQAAIAV